MSQENARITLHNAAWLRKQLGISKDNAYRILHAGGLQIGGLYYITLDRLDHFLNDTPGVPLTEAKKTKRTRPYKKRSGPGKG